MANETIDIIVSGHLCLDLIPSLPANVTSEALAVPGRLWEVGSMALSTGGVVSNTGLALHRLGVKVRLMATVGDDLIGQAIIGFLKNRDEALADLISVQSGQPSSYTIVLAPHKTDRTFLHCTGTNDTFGVANVDFALVEQAKIFHLGYPPLLPRMYAADGQELRQIYEQVKARGIVTSLDMSLPDPQSASGRANWIKILQKTLPYVDIFLPSLEEILFMLRREEFDKKAGRVYEGVDRAYLSALADELIAMGVVIAGFKMGEHGLYVKTASAPTFRRLERLKLNIAQWANAEVWSPTFQVEVVGTVGAGDATYAGFLTGLLLGLSPQEAVTSACAVGACNVEAADATSGVRSWEETQARLQAGWATNPVKLEGF